MIIDNVLPHGILHKLRAAARLFHEMRDFQARVALCNKLNLRFWSRVHVWVMRYRSTIGRRQRVVAVVGSLGKTTTTRAIMTALYGRAPEWIHRADNCFSLVGINLLRQGPWKRLAVLEVGIGWPGQMGTYAAMLRPDLVVLTALATDHQVNFGGTEKLWQEKALMIRGLRDGGTAIINGDDSNVRRVVRELAVRTISYGFSEGCDISGRGITISPGGTAFTLIAEGQSWPVHSRLVGRESVRALLAAVAAGRMAGLDFSTLLARLSRLMPTPGRMQPIPLSNGAVAICDDFKSSVESIHAALDVLGQMQTVNRRVVVLGDIYHPPRPRVARYVAVGRHAGSVADHVVLVGRRVGLYRVGLADTGCPVDVASSVVEAAALLREQLRPGDVMLIKGRGEQKLARIALILAGRDVRCRRVFCTYDNVLCAVCPQLSDVRGSI